MLRPFSLLFLFFLFGLATLAACGSSASGVEPRVEDEELLVSQAAADITIVELGAPRLTLLQPIPRFVVLSPGESTILSVLAFDQHGRELSPVSFTWQVVDPRAGSITPNGLFRAGFTNGHFDESVVVTAQFSSPNGPVVLQETASVTVAELNRERLPADIVVVPESVEILPNDASRLTAFVVDANGIMIPQGQVHWEMLVPQAGSVSLTGSFTASKNIGHFPDAIRVSFDSSRQPDVDLSRTLDVRVLEPDLESRGLAATVLPRVISLSPEAEFRFTAIILDQNGNRFPPRDLSWQVLDKDAGSISQDGRFVASSFVGTYVEAIQVTLTAPDVEEQLIATGTVLIVDNSQLTLEVTRLPTTTIFPERLVLSPRESARVSVIGLEGLAGSESEVTWSLSPPGLGTLVDHGRFSTTTVRGLPGLYENAIQAKVSFEGETGPIELQLSTDLVVRGPLDSVEIIPMTATLESGSRIQFRATAYDEGRIPLPDVNISWSVSDPDAGQIDDKGQFLAGDSPGTFPAAVQVTVTQRPIIPPG